MEKYINLFTDYGFKKVFGEEPNKDLLISFLNSLLPAKHQIADLEYSRSEWQGVSAAERRAVMDLHCKAPDERLAYENSLKSYRDLKNVTDTAFDEGKEVGIAEGKEIGIAEGKEIGIAAGKEIGEQQKALEVARMAIAIGLPDAQIAALSGFNEVQIADMRRQASA